MNPAGALALKLVLTPLLVGAASLAEGLFAFASFFLVVSLLLPEGIALAFVAAAAVAAAVQSLSLYAGRTLGLA